MFASGFLLSLFLSVSKALLFLASSFLQGLPRSNPTGELDPFLNLKRVWCVFGGFDHKPQSETFTVLRNMVGGCLAVTDGYKWCREYDTLNVGWDKLRTVNVIGLHVVAFCEDWLLFVNLLCRQNMAKPFLDSWPFGPCIDWHPSSTGSSWTEAYRT